MVDEESESSDEQEMFPSVNVTGHDRQKCSKSIYYRSIQSMAHTKIPRNYGFEALSTNVVFK